MPQRKPASPEVPANAGYGELDAKAFTFSAAGELRLQTEKQMFGLPTRKKYGLAESAHFGRKGQYVGRKRPYSSGEYVRSVWLSFVPAKSAAVSLKIMAMNRILITVPARPC